METCFLSKKEIEDLESYVNVMYEKYNHTFDLELLINDCKKLNIKSKDDINEYTNAYYEFNNFIKELLESLKEDNIIIYSNRSYYYSLTNDKVKGYKGYEKAQKFIFNNYVVNSYQYQNLLKYEKENFKEYVWYAFDDIPCHLHYMDDLSVILNYNEEDEDEEDKE